MYVLDLPLRGRPAMRRRRAFGALETTIFQCPLRLRRESNHSHPRKRVIWVRLATAIKLTAENTSNVTFNTT